jgi:small subunit ribosomal protein S21
MQSKSLHVSRKLFLYCIFLTQSLIYIYRATHKQHGIYIYITYLIKFSILQPPFFTIQTLNKDMKHLNFIARTVLVENKQLDKALKALGKVVSSEKISQTARLWETYEKPFERRNRLSFQKCTQMYASEIDRKIRFVVRKNRENPYPWD